MASGTARVAVEDGLDELVELLGRHQELAHLRVRKRGDSLIVFSGDGDDEQKHARMTYLGQGAWGLGFPNHSGKWEPTPFIGSLAVLMETLAQDFGLFLTQE
jgi:hypothetical protein